MTQQDEIRFYGEWAIFVAEFLEAHGPTHPFLGMQARLFEQAMEAGNLKGLKMLPKDLTATARDYPKHVQEQLEAALIGRFGVGLSDRMKKERVAVGVLIARGTVETEAERQLLQARIQEIGDLDSRLGELRAIERLLNPGTDTDKAKR